MYSYFAHSSFQWTQEGSHTPLSHDYRMFHGHRDIAENIFAHKSQVSMLWKQTVTQWRPRKCNNKSNNKSAQIYSQEVNITMDVLQQRAMRSAWTDFSHRWVLSSLMDIDRARLCGYMELHVHICIVSDSQHQNALLHKLHTHSWWTAQGTTLVFHWLFIQAVIKMMCSHVLPFSHFWPTQPAGHVHFPSWRSHTPPFSHSHECWQSAPKKPGAHSVKKAERKSL